jgi:O-antigen ligase
VCAVLLLILLLLGTLARPTRRIRWCPRTTIPWLLLLGAVTLSLPLSFNKTVTVYRGILLVQHIVLYFTFANLLKTEADIDWALKCLVLALVLGGSLYLVSCFTSKDFDLVTGAGRELAKMDEYGGVVRPAGTFGHPIQAGQYFIGAIWISVALLGVSRYMHERILLYISFALGSVCIIYTLSRAAYIGYVCGLLSYLLYGVRSGLVRVSNAIASAMIVFVLLVLIGGLAWSRLTLDDKGSGEGRTPLNKQAVYIAGKHPFVGVGAGAYGLAMGGYQPPGVEIAWQAYVHNEYLLWWAECGTPGLLALFLFLASAVHVAWRAAKTQSPALRAPGFALLCMIAALLPNMWYDAGAIGTATACARLLTVVLGIIAAAMAIAHEKQSAEENSVARA